MFDVSAMQRANARTLTSAPQRGGILIWLAMSFLLIAGLFVFSGLFLAHSIKVHESRTGNDVQVDTPFGSIHVQHHGNGTSESAGMPMYPGAKPLRGSDTATVDLSEFFGNNDLHIVAGKWETSDPIDKVQKYYEDKFPDMSVVHHTGKVEMHSVNKHGKRIVVLCERGAGTEISLASVGEPKAN